MRALSHLTLEQEKEIVSDRKLFLVAVCLLNHVTFAQIVETYDISSAECVKLLARLDPPEVHRALARQPGEGPRFTHVRLAAGWSDPAVLSTTTRNWLVRLCLYGHLLGG
jgi:hypothetical protein